MTVKKKRFGQVIKVMSEVPFTTPVRKGHEIDEAALYRYLKANVATFGSKIVSLRQFEGML